MGAMPMERVRLSVVAAGDTARPESMETDATAPYGAAALTASYAMVTTHRIGMDVYATAAQTHSFGTGGHLGLETLLKHLWGWRVRLRMEGMLFTDGYNWAPFDLLYLIRRQRIIASNEGADQQGFGGRLLLKMEQKSVELGIETSGAIGSPQQTNTLWVALPKKPFHIFAVFHAGRHTDSGTRLTIETSRRDFSPIKPLRKVDGGEQYYPCSTGQRIGISWISGGWYFH